MCVGDGGDGLYTNASIDHGLGRCVLRGVGAFYYDRRSGARFDQVLEKHCIKGERVRVMVGSSEDTGDNRAGRADRVGIRCGGDSHVRA